MDRIEITENVSGSRIRIETKSPRCERHVQRFDRGDLRGRVPAGADVKFTTVNGGIEVSGLTGEIEAETTNGGITAREVSGAIEATTTNGGVDVELMQVARGGVKLGCTNGGIKLRLPADAAANISASVANGGIDADGLHLETTESTRRSLEGKMNGGGPPIGSKARTAESRSRQDSGFGLARAATRLPPQPPLEQREHRRLPFRQGLDAARRRARSSRGRSRQCAVEIRLEHRRVDVALPADGLRVAEALGDGLDRPHDVALRLRLGAERLRSPAVAAPRARSRSTSGSPST